MSFFSGLKATIEQQGYDTENGNKQDSQTSTKFVLPNDDFTQQLMSVLKAKPNATQLTLPVEFKYVQISKDHDSHQYSFILPLCRFDKVQQNQQELSLQEYELTNLQVGLLAILVQKPQFIGNIAINGTPYKTVMCEDYSADKFQQEMQINQNFETIQRSLLSNKMLLAVVGAHLKGMPLHWQIEQCQGKFVAEAYTLPQYKLYELAGTNPPKPGLIQQEAGQQGSAIFLEVFNMSIANFGKFVGFVPQPLGIGNVLVEASNIPKDYSNHVTGIQEEVVKGFVCQGYVAANSIDVSHFQSWREYMKHKQA